MTDPVDLGKEIKLGQTCGICGMWYEYSHQCPSLGGAASAVSTRWVNPPWVDNGALQRIAAALERIAEALEKSGD